MAVLSEELNANVSYSLGDLLFRRLGSTTYENLFDANILARKPNFSDEYRRKKPDAIIYNSAGELFAVIEEKVDLSTPQKVNDAIEQCRGAASELTRLLIVTDNNNKTIYVNTQAQAQDNLVVSAEGRPLPVLNLRELQRKTGSSSERSLKLQGIVKNAAVSLSADNNRLSVQAALDPTNLAKTMWQKIFVVTGKEPEKCLYNVVELFIFKLLSDLNVLKHPEDFTTAFELAQNKNDSALRQYAQISRPRIKQFFPISPSDGTTLINGTIFVNETGGPCLSNASLFNDLVQRMYQYGEENGSFQHIQAEFKTRLFESFLRQSASVSQLGQFFTPRNVVQAIVKMSKVSDLSPGQSLLDPFCGVGGFVLEAITESENIYREFIPKDEQIAPRIIVEGWDRGSEEKDEQRTIILAKANMLIYLSDIIAEHHSEAVLQSFARQGLSRTFKLIKEAGGTFSREPKPQYDVILTNPPYVRSGSKVLKEQLKQFQPRWNGQGTEALALEWIIRALKPGGQAFVVVPDGLLRQHQFMLEAARLVRFDLIAKLPPSTFYSTPKVTYIIGLTKKRDVHSSSQGQKEPVLGFVVREIGETRDAKRWGTVSDLPVLESAFRLFSMNAAAEEIEKISQGLGKVLNFSDILEQGSFNVDRTFWSPQEMQRLGVEEEEKTVSSEDFVQGLEELRGLVDDFLGSRLSEPADGNGESRAYRSISLGSKRYFTGFRTGKSVSHSILWQSSGSVPVFSSSMHGKPSGYISQEFARKHGVPVFVRNIKWNINGSVGNPTYVDHPFSVTSDVGIFKVEDPALNPDFVALQLSGKFYGFDWNNKAGVGKILKMSIKVPVNENNELDRAAQDRAVKYSSLRQETRKLVARKIDDLCSVKVEVPVYFERTKTICLEDSSYFRHVKKKLGSSWSMKRFRDIESAAQDSIPVYTAAKTAKLRVCRNSVPPGKVIAVTADDAIFSFAADGDGSAGKNFVHHREDFVVQANRVVVQIMAQKLSVSYILAQLATMRQEYGFNRAFKAKWDHVKKIPLVVPVSSGGILDDVAQRQWVNEYLKVRCIKGALCKWRHIYVG